MASTPNPRPNPAGQRRSQRILLAVPVQVSGERNGGAVFQEDTTTLLVNAHGALLQMREPVQESQVLRLKNISTGEQIPCVVKDIGNTTGAFTEIGVEFSEPRPRFWRVAFPPPDWTPRSPEAKRFVSSSAVAPKPVK